MPTRLQIQSATAIARHLAEAACSERHSEAALLLDTAVRFLRDCRYAGLSSDYIHDTATGFRDAIASLHAGIDTDLDEAGLWPSEPLDLSELDALIVELGR